MNVVNLVGRLTKPPEMKISTSGKPYCFNVIAIKSKYDTEFIGVSFFGEIAKWLNTYFDKGKFIAITGHLEQGTQDNNYRMSVIADKAYFCERINR